MIDVSGFWGTLFVYTGNSLSSVQRSPHVALVLCLWCPLSYFLADCELLSLNVFAIGSSLLNRPYYCGRRLLLAVRNVTDART